MSYVTHARVRFAHVDPAGIVFYPRYFEMLNGALEDYFADVVGTDFAQMHIRRRIGVPTVKLESEFVAVSRLGDHLDFTVHVERVGRSSAELDIAARCAGELRFRARLVIVCMDLDAGRAFAWPDDLRPLLEPAAV